MVYDLIIIGAGPAGITASVYAVRKRMNLLVISSDIGGQAAWSGDIENYTGYQFITGPELSAKFEEHIKKYNISLKQNETVREVEKRDDLISVKSDKGSYKCKTLIAASGKRSKELGVKGEREFKNKGLTYCATCDAPLFSQKDVAVIGGGNSALDAALQLIRIAKKVYIVHINSKLQGDEIIREKITHSEKVTILNNTRVEAISGDNLVREITVAGEDGSQTLKVEGVFVEIGLIPNSEFTKGIEKNAGEEIKINSHNETNVPGIFAAGDVTDVPEKQIIIAAGEGSKAALGAFKYLAQSK